MKKSFYAFVLILMMVFTTASCSQNTSQKDRIVNMFYQNEDVFILAAQSGDFSKIKKVKGVHEVYEYDSYVDIFCMGSGFGSSTHYFGIFYSETDDLCAIDVAGPRDELYPSGDGYRYTQNPGDNEYYVEALGHHYFYYEAHF